MNKEVKIRRLDNGFILTVFDLGAETRKPISKLLAKDIKEIEILLKDIYKK